MNLVNFSSVLQGLGLTSGQPVKRVAKLRNCWGIETEQLEDRALLSAVGKLNNLSADAQVATLGKSHGKAVEIPNVAGNFTVQITAANTPLGNIDVSDTSVDFTQKGKAVTGDFAAENTTAAIKAKLKGKGLTQAAVKAKVNIFGQAFLAKMTVNYDSTDHFSGQATIKKFGNIVVHIEGTRNVT